MYKRLEAGTFAALERDEINARELYLCWKGSRSCASVDATLGYPPGGKVILVYCADVTILHILW